MAKGKAGTPIVANIAWWWKPECSKARPTPSAAKGFRATRYDAKHDVHRYQAATANVALKFNHHAA